MRSGFWTPVESTGLPTPEVAESSIPAPVGEDLNFESPLAGHHRFNLLRVLSAPASVPSVINLFLLGILVRPTSLCGLIFMLSLFFSSDYPGSAAIFWQYFGASLSHSVFALCFAAFLLGRSDSVWSLPAWRPSK
jgi:hypothetical protein